MTGRFAVIHGKWRDAPFFRDPPPPPPGYSGKGKHDCYMGYLTAYKYRLECADVAAMHAVEGRTE